MEYTATLKPLQSHWAFNKPACPRARTSGRGALGSSPRRAFTTSGSAWLARGVRAHLCAGSNLRRLAVAPQRPAALRRQRRRRADASASWAGSTAPPPPLLCTFQRRPRLDSVPSPSSRAARSALAFRPHSYQHSASRAGGPPSEPPGPAAKPPCGRAADVPRALKRLLLCDFPEEPPSPPL